MNVKQKKVCAPAGNADVSFNISCVKEGVGMKRKITLVCEIVDWEHRYGERQLMGGEFCLRRVETLMTALTYADVLALWRRTFELNRAPVSADSNDASPVGGKNE